VKEYGNAISMSTTSKEPTDEETATAHRMLRYNYERQKKMHPEYGLTACKFVTGPSQPMWEYQDCTTCNGEGFLRVYVDAAEDWVDSACEICGGIGLVPWRVKEGWWQHTWGWYELVN
jgi:hypothetical protein